ncbi:MAG: alpha-hydroxy-acid oxidizing protein, partial [Actinomycetota bacterium]|nr:alpha-hydroxy-acid oxidizing protein [Actinomycetota bacterium]
MTDRVSAEAATAARKRDHLQINLHDEVSFATLTTGLEAIRVRARALPERDLDTVDLSLRLWGRRLAAPLLVSCMTGGVGEAGPVNRALAEAAQAHRVAMGLGSGRALLEGADPASFHVRDVAPDVLLLANLGAVQLRQYGPAACARLVAACQADALVLHLNAVQEAIQAAGPSAGGRTAGTAGGVRPPGDTAFGGVLARIAEVCARLEV